MLAWSKKSHSQVEANDIKPPTSEALGVNNAELMDLETDKKDVWTLSQQLLSIIGYLVVMGRSIGIG